MRVALDTNILVYAEGVNGSDRRAAAIHTIKKLQSNEIILPVQALGELYAVLVRKVGRTANDARAAVLGWPDAYPVADSTPATLIEAIELATAHRFGVWDAIILALAAQAGCRLLLSDDMQSGFSWRGVTIRNPFDGPPLSP